MKNEIVGRMITNLDRINTATASIISPELNWRKAGWDFELAVTMEAAEGLNSEGWTWWRPAVPDVDNCRLELIDCWHFMLASFMCSVPNDDAVLVNYVQDFLSTRPFADKRSPATLWRLLMETDNGFSAKAFGSLRDHYALNDASFARLFFAKSELNILRAANGYSNGSYIKNWGTKSNKMEDNVVVTEIAHRYNLLEIKELPVFVRNINDYYQWVKGRDEK